MKKIVLVACGSGIATSTIVSDVVQQMINTHKLDAEIIQCKITEVPGYFNRAHLLVTTTIVQTDYPIPVVNARAFLTGIGLDSVKQQILQQLEDNGEEL